MKLPYTKDVRRHPLAEGLRLETSKVFETVRRHGDEGQRFRVAPDYEATDVSRKIARIVLSDTEYVNRGVRIK